MWSPSRNITKLSSGHCKGIYTLHRCSRQSLSVWLRAVSKVPCWRHWHRVANLSWLSNVSISLLYINSWHPISSLQQHDHSYSPFDVLSSVCANTRSNDVWIPEGCMWMYTRLLLTFGDAPCIKLDFLRTQHIQNITASDTTLFTLGHNIQ